MIKLSRERENVNDKYSKIDIVIYMCTYLPIPNNIPRTLYCRYTHKSTYNYIFILNAVKIKQYNIQSNKLIHIVYNYTVCLE